MAIIRDPNNPIDEEERRQEARERSLGRRIADDFAQTGQYLADRRDDALGYLPGAAGRFKQNFRRDGLVKAVTEDFRDTGNAISSAAGAYQRGVDSLLPGLAGSRQNQPEAEVPLRPEVQIVEPELDQFSRGDIRSTANSRQNGLTRIVKTADGTYVQTSDPNVQGEERIYDELGGRADRVTNDKGALDMRQAFAQEQAGANLMDTEEGRREIMARGQGSLERIGRMNEESGARRDKTFMDNLAPADRAKLMEAQAKENGLDRRANATNELTRSGQQAALITAKTNATVKGQEQLRYQRERLNDPETREAAFREFFGGLPDDKAARIDALVNSDAGKQIMDAALQAGAKATGDPGFNPAAASKRDGLMRNFNPFTDGSFLGGFDPTKGGLTEPDYELVIEAARQRYAGR